MKGVRRVRPQSAYAEASFDVSVCGPGQVTSPSAIFKAATAASPSLTGWQCMAFGITMCGNVTEDFLAYS